MMIRFARPSLRIFSAASYVRSSIDSGNTIVFGDYDMCLEFDEAKKTLTVHVGNPQDEEFGRFDGGEMSMQ